MTQAIDVYLGRTAVTVAWTIELIFL